MRPPRAAKLRSRGKTGSTDVLCQETDPVQVFCRLRPKEVGSGEGVCCKLIDDTTVQLTLGQVQYKFTKVFDEKASQKCIFDNTASPLVEDLLHGKNGLLFTYGVTNSGKTFTMSGSTDEPGVLPRSLDMVFNSIGSRLARKYIFKPDGCNGFDVRSVADAMMERQKKDVIPSADRGFGQSNARGRDMPELDDRVRDTSLVQDMDDDCSYAVFVSFVEVYNNSVYDLLEDLMVDPITGTRPPMSKVLRDDSKRGVMYVHNVNEVEVTCPEEAFELLNKGQKRRKVAHTVLNAESSRSHSVFTVRLVQAPLDATGQEILQDKDKVLVTQLCLVDLAGSERTNRTKNSGERLKEAGQINQSLMVLRNCIDILRENQKTSSNKIVPYRESRMTHLFKSYFEGEGKVRMIVCVNPKLSESDETAHVMKFAEATQEVQIARAQPQRIDVPFTPGRRGGTTDEPYVPLPPSIGGGLYSLGSPFPPTELHSAEDGTVLQPLESYLEDLLDKRRSLNADLARRQDEFRRLLTSVTSDERQWQSRVEELQAGNDSLEKRLATVEREKERLQQRLDSAEARVRQTADQLMRAERELAVAADERERIKADFRNKFTVVNQEHEKQLERERQRWQLAANERISLKDQRLRMVRNIVNTPSDAESLAGEVASAPAVPRYASATVTSSRAAASARSDEARSATAAATGASSASSQTVSTPLPKPRPPQLMTMSATPVPYRTRARSPPPTVAPKPAASVLRNHRRSRSAGDKWLDHKPPETVEIDTVLQPNIKKKRSVSKVDVRDTKETTKYLLTHQEPDAKGVMETKLIKGDVIPTAGGGSSVVFTDVETLKQTSPGERKRRCVQPQPSDYDGEWTDTEDRCKVAIEGHGALKKIRGDMKL